MKKDQKLWSREELILALNLYLKLPFGKLDKRTPEVKHLAWLINRSDNAVSMRLNNFASVDPFHKQRGIKGLEGGKKQVQPIWDEFIHNKEDLIFESEKILANKENIKFESKYDRIFREVKDLKGEDKIRAVKTRVNQNVFRDIVVANYDCKCAISGIDIPDLLLASHIVPWTANENERLNPSNGICLSALYDKAFDKGYFTITSKYKLLLSPQLIKHRNKDYYEMFFSKLKDASIIKPHKYLPNKEFLEYHAEAIFKK